MQSRLASLQAFRDENFALTVAIYFVFYVVATGISIPGAILLTLLGGAIFGLWWGTLLVSFASSIGATGAFLASYTPINATVGELSEVEVTFVGGTWARDITAP